MIGFRVWLELSNWPPGTSEYIDYPANHHHTGPDGSLFLRWQEQRPGGLDLVHGLQQMVMESRHVATLRGGTYPLWRYVDVVELPAEAPPRIDVAEIDPATQTPVTPEEFARRLYPDEPPWHERGPAVE